MSTSTSAPATYKQPSRKGKKAWRKNIDVTEVQEGLDEVREQIIDGGLISEKTADQLFAIDTVGSSDLQKAHNKRHKPLKVDEILAQRSAVPAVSNLKKRLSDFEAPKTKKPRISHKDYDKLRAIAYGGDAVQKDVVETGGTADHDPWAVQEVKQDPRYSFLEKKKATREPATLKRAPVSLAKSGKQMPAVKKPEAGKSYNPLLEDWANLLEREGNKEVEAEKQRLQEAREEAAIMERAMKEDEEAEANESTWESEWEGFSDAEGNELKKKRPERKTPTQRSKIRRRKAAEAEAKHQARMKEREKQAQRIKELVKSIEAKEKAKASAIAKATNQNDASSDEEEDEVLRKRRFGKYPVPQAPLEVVLADELQDSLRRLKPEGSLLNDRMRSMLIRGRVESRKQTQKKQRKTTTSEKWSYKDWSLDKHV
ncbi:p60 domain-containing protein [Aaosphaeria arxii CBS 175.79]|uniref:Ribosome biogenesis protein NOP53 n=1 Tax=Aaosphaeria arxii CBS 175.79 TaxID=1450172 RepID=A0A6A5XBC7_9PLEO|nr:p60 domain-containing protein [Aaosphaeria arxii CBS 175.79]KAF2010074.1 p60 domain-containing protein [Aaosphaeria arxii CBS 175.79]